MKKLMLLIMIVAVLIFAGCTKILELPNIDGVWNANAVVEGAVLSFEMNIEAGEYVFESGNIAISDGKFSHNGMIYFMLTVNDRGYGFYGNVEGSYMSGFVRKGEAGNIVGNWSASR